MTPDDIALAAEYALGLLDGDELNDARRRLLSDRDFAAEAARWRAWLATLLASYPEAVPAAALEERIVAPQQPAVVAPRRVWRWAVAGVMAAAVVLFALVLGPLRTPPPMAVPSRPLLAALAVPDAEVAPGRVALAAVADRLTGEIRIAGSTAVPANRSAQLWAIGKDAAPVPIGLLAGTGPTRVTLSVTQRQLLVEGTTLAVSIEPTGGSPTGAPTGPVVAAGALALS